MKEMMIDSNVFSVYACIVVIQQIEDICYSDL